MLIASGQLLPVASPSDWAVDARACLTLKYETLLLSRPGSRVGGINKTKAVFQCALEAFYFDDLSRVWFGAPWILAGIIGGAMLGWGLVSFADLSHAKLLITLCCLGRAVIGIFLATQINFTRLRPYLRRVVEERKNEIARIS